MTVRLAALARCPFDWPGSVPSDDAGPSSAGSPQGPKPVRRRILTAQSEVAASCDDWKTIDEELPLDRWLRARYFECLWLGEHHFPLADFPLVLNQLLKRSRKHQGSADALETHDNTLNTQKFRHGYTAEGRLEALLGPGTWASSAVSQENRSSLIGGEEEDVSVKTALISGQGSLVAAEVRRAWELRLLRTAERESQLSKPTDPPGGSLDESALAANINSSSSSGYKLRDQWLAAIERRELSLQVLLILETLRLSVEHPGILAKVAVRGSNKTPHRPSIAPLQKAAPADSFQLADDSPNDPETDLTGTASTSTYEDSQRNLREEETQSQDTQVESQDPCAPKKKRKRKSAPARRWTGMPTAFGFDSLPSSSSFDGEGFPWLKRPNRPGETPNAATPDDEAAGEEQGEDALDGLSLICDAEKLHRRFEGLVDRLSLRIVTAELAKDFAAIGSPEKQATTTAEADQSVDAKASTKAPPIFFGTSARRRDDRDERDELHHLCSDIVEPRFSRLLPRQCSILQSRATGGTSATPARPVRSRTLVSSEGMSLSGAVSNADNSVEQLRRKKEEQLLKQTRTELDLISKRKIAAGKAKEREARKASQRPGLKDALVLEQKERRGSRASSTAADAERFKREVSVKRRVGFARSSSLSGNALTASLQSETDQQSSQKPPLQQRNDNVAASSNTSNRPHKRKIAEPQRFGGLANAAAQPSSLRTVSDPASSNAASHRGTEQDDDNPFRDVRNTISHGASASVLIGKPGLFASAMQSSQLLPAQLPQQARSTMSSAFNRSSSFARSSSQSFGQSQIQQSQRYLDQPDGILKRAPAATSMAAPKAPLSSGGRGSAAWQRTESQPVTSRDLSSLSDATYRDMRPGGKPESQTNGESQSNQPMTRSRTPLVTSQSQPADLSLALSTESFDDVSEDDRSDIEAADEGGEDEEEEEEEEEMLVFNRRHAPPVPTVSRPEGDSGAARPLLGVPRGMSRTASALSALRGWATAGTSPVLGTAPLTDASRTGGSAAVLGASQSQDAVSASGTLLQENTPYSEASQPPIAIAPVRHPPALRVPSGRNPFAKTISVGRADAVIDATADSQPRGPFGVKRMASTEMTHGAGMQKKRVFVEESDEE
ncbi:hypothetical protein BCV69DRAFT_161354 [Microstroma glucosiphilum]|uniref:DNA replication regulator Sld3 C-terminal domain-containing protein n=1 Tax=Pseudomicrostroma glucosiphilum TaxID=1684307 RepID=A0A316U9T4_9BASI|nr:hypothetical protein BCV69DRAFT_161354 [Pseudomicrostroma glucosiphilum]PWN21966.1 hypothetical protein BCV69DRAFT_161354 [Pseudomicrostroma glucosiphilum]